MVSRIRGSSAGRIGASNHEPLTKALPGLRAFSAQPKLATAGHGAITTEILPAPPFYYAEDYHQQDLGKKPGGYCGLGGTGVSCPIGLRV